MGPTGSSPHCRQPTLLHQRKAENTVLANPAVNVSAVIPLRASVPNVAYCLIRRSRLRTASRRVSRMHCG